MTKKLTYKLLYSTFQYHTDPNNSQEWRATGQVYAIDESHRNAAIIDIPKSKIYFISLLDSEREADFTARLADLASTSNASESSIKSALQIGGANEIHAYYDTISISKEGAYKDALADNPDINTDVNDFANFISQLAATSAATSANTRTIKSAETATPLIYAADPQLIDFNASDDMRSYNGLMQQVTIIVNQSWLNNTFSEINAEQANGITIELDDDIVNLMNKNSNGFYVNLSDESFSYGSGANEVSLDAKTAKFITKDDSYYINLNINSNIISATGTKYNDYLIGDSNINYFEPGNGADVVFGGGYPDPNSIEFEILEDWFTGFVNCDENYQYRDRVSYWLESGKGIVVAGSTYAADSGERGALLEVKDPSGSIDKLYDIDNLIGSCMDDKFTGITNSYQDKFLIEFSGYAGNDTIDGKNTTLISYAYDPGGVTVNLSKSTYPNINGLKVKSESAVDGFGFIDTVKNIAGVRGSEFDDEIILSDKSDFAFGGDGNDVIYGNRGNDFIVGGMGNDIIIPGKGLDVIFGDWMLNLDPDSSLFYDSNPIIFQDTVKFISPLDSNSKSLTTLEGDFVGDIILDFSTIVDLSAIDANSKLRGNQAFFIGGDEFHNLPGELIFKSAILDLTNEFFSDWGSYFDPIGNMYFSEEFRGEGTLILGDLQGDGVADLSIFTVDSFDPWWADPPKIIF